MISGLRTLPKHTWQYITTHKWKWAKHNCQFMFVQPKTVLSLASNSIAFDAHLLIIPNFATFNLLHSKYFIFQSDKNKNQFQMANMIHLLYRRKKKEKQNTKTQSINKKLVVFGNSRSTAMINYSICIFLFIARGWPVVHAQHCQIEVSNISSKINKTIKIAYLPKYCDIGRKRWRHGNTVVHDAPINNRCQLPISHGQQKARMKKKKKK